MESENALANVVTSMCHNFHVHLVTYEVESIDILI